MLRWRIYYLGGRTFSNEDGSPAEAPGRGVVCIAQADDACGRLVPRGFYAYLWLPDAGQWIGVLRDGLESRVFDFPGSWTRAVHGAMVSEAEYAEIVTIAQTDPDLPPRSGKRRHEEPRAA